MIYVIVVTNQYGEIVELYIRGWDNLVRCLKDGIYNSYNIIDDEYPVWAYETEELETGEIVPRLDKPVLAGDGSGKLYTNDEEPE